MAGDKQVICEKSEAENFFARDWTGRNSLIRLEKLDFTRNSAGAHRADRRLNTGSRRSGRLTAKHWRPTGMARDDNFEMARTPADATLLSTERRMTPSAVHRHRICGHS
jgi:hypothetical protein